MFKSDKKFTSLDDFFNVGKSGHKWSKDEIEKRINEVQSLYHEWSFHLWRFAEDEDQRERIQDFAWTTISTLRQAAICHILGLYLGSIFYSSAAVERCIHCILLACKSIYKENVPQDAKVIEVNTISGKAYYYNVPSFGLEPIEYESGTRYYFRLPTLGSKTLSDIEKLGFSPKLLLDREEDYDNCSFIARRHAIAHARYERLDLIEEGRNLFTTLVPNPYPIYDEQSSLDQYKKASKFIAGTFECFDKIFGYIDDNLIDKNKKS